MGVNGQRLVYDVLRTQSTLRGPGIACSNIILLDMVGQACNKRPIEVVKLK